LSDSRTASLRFNLIVENFGKARRINKSMIVAHDHIIIKVQTAGCHVVNKFNLASMYPIMPILFVPPSGIK
jgi:hypothetical protein